MEKAELLKCFEYLSTESNEHDFVSELDEVPTPLNFLRNWVSPNRPVIIRQGIKHWPAVDKWRDWNYLREKIGSKEVSVAWTPNGYADSVYQGKFVMPYEERMTMSRFLDVLSGIIPRNGIPYIQKQNSNLLEEFSELMEDVEKQVTWAAEVLGGSPDAVNFWMGDHRAVTSLHKDHYENLYCVISGYKDFILYRPTDLPWIPYDEFTSAKFNVDSNGEYYLEDVIPENKVPWIPLDPLHPDLNRFPQYVNATPIHCRIEAGDIFYLPSLWFHHVRQSHGCIAVNYWHDMDFDIKYNYFKFLEMLTSKLNKTKF